MKKMLFFSIALGLFFSAGAFGINPAIAGDDKKFEVTITNLTKGQSFTPILVASHKKGVKLFKLGMPASPALADLAEGGATGPLTTLLLDNPMVLDVANSMALLSPTMGLLMPGKSVTVEVDAGKGFNYISVASMLLPTNDGFFAINGKMGPKGKKTIVLYSPAYDAGTEENDELCASIPGPLCGGTPFSTLSPSDEGFVHIHSGIHGIGSMMIEPSLRDWKNPVAKITIRRVK